jgi:hypothetical protein
MYAWETRQIRRVEGCVLNAHPLPCVVVLHRGLDLDAAENQQKPLGKHSCALATRPAGQCPAVLCGNATIENQEPKTRF